MNHPNCSPTYARLEEILDECLGYLPEYVDGETPCLSFGYFSTNFEDLGAKIVANEQRTDVGQQLTEAYVWCTDRFPLSVRTHVTHEMKRSIVRFIVGHSKHEDEVLSASSAQAPGVVFIAAEWPVRSPYRLASLIAHEGIHQALFIRELESSPVRHGSLGYSPWKNTLRPGRMVWHAFWTFTCQTAMLAESLLTDPSLLSRDPRLTDFLADMEARISVCLYSLELSNIVSSCEFERCNRAFGILSGLFRELARLPKFDQAQVEAGHVARAEFEMWARCLEGDHSLDNARA